MNPGGEIGDILGIWTADPRATTKFRGIPYEEGDGVIQLFEDRTTAWVEYQTPPPDLLSVEDADLDDYEIPARFANILAYQAAGSLLRADGKYAAGNEYMVMAERLLAEESQRLKPPRRWSLQRGDFN
jgi:hypothetical protein